MFGLFKRRPPPDFFAAVQGGLGPSLEDIKALPAGKKIVIPEKHRFALQINEMNWRYYWNVKPIELEGPLFYTEPVEAPITRPWLQALALVAHAIVAIAFLLMIAFLSWLPHRYNVSVVSNSYILLDGVILGTICVASMAVGMRDITLCKKRRFYDAHHRGRHIYRPKKAEAAWIEGLSEIRPASEAPKSLIWKFTIMRKAASLVTGVGLGAMIMVLILTSLEIAAYPAARGADEVKVRYFDI